MWETVGEIVLWVVLAGVAGLGVGIGLSSIRGRERKESADRLAGRARDEMAVAREEARRTAEERDALAQELAVARGQGLASGRALAERDARIAALGAELAAERQLRTRLEAERVAPRPLPTGPVEPPLSPGTPGPPPRAVEEGDGTEP